MATQTVLVSGLSGAIGSDLRETRSQVVFVEYGGKLSALNLIRSASVVSSGSRVLPGTWTFDLEDGSIGGLDATNDLWWEQQTAVERRMTPWRNAQIVNLGVVDFNSVTPASLQQLSYTTTPINGDDNATNVLVPGNVFAVRTNQGNYSKVRVLSYGYNIRLQWVTYRLRPAYVVLGSGYQQPEDVKVSADDAYAYVTERIGTLLKVKLTNANRSEATVVATGMTAPHQIVLDEGRDAAYVVEHAASGSVWRIDLTDGSRTEVVTGLAGAVGLALSADLQFAYVSEQAPAGGQVSEIRLSDGARRVLVGGLTNPFLLTWADPSQTSLLIPERDPANQVVLVDVTTGARTVVAASVPSRPSSVVVLSPGQMVVCCDDSISKIDFVSSGFQPAGPLLMGIGFIPFDKVEPSGLADTSGDPGYFYQVKDTPFGGSLPIMVNYLRAFNEGAAYYRIKVDGAARTDSWSDYRWDGLQYVIQTTAPSTVAGNPGYYPVHSLSELFLWMNPSLGGMVDSADLSNGLHAVELEFTNGSGVVITSTAAVTILVNNESCVATLAAPSLNGASADPQCGVLVYAAKNDAEVSMAFVASHPANFADFSFSLIKGVHAVTTMPADPPTSGPVSVAVSPLTNTVANLLGGCTVAGFGEYLYVAATANNGWSRQSQYDASDAVAFVLAP